MKLEVYKPSSKGLLNSKIKGNECVLFLNEQLVYLEELPDGNFKFVEGDVFEYHPKSLKPDSLWRSTGIMIETLDIIGFDKLNDNSVDILVYDMRCLLIK